MQNQALAWVLATLLVVVVLFLFLCYAFSTHEDQAVQQQPNNPVKEVKDELDTFTFKGPLPGKSDGEGARRLFELPGPVFGERQSEDGEDWESFFELTGPEGGWEVLDSPSPTEYDGTRLLDGHQPEAPKD